MPSLPIFTLTVLIYLALAAYFRPGGRACCQPNALGRLLLFVPLVFHIYLLATMILPGTGLVLGFGSSLSAVAALTVLFYGLAAWHYPLSGMQSFVLTFAGLAVALKAILPAGHVIATADQPLFRIHLLMAFVAYGLFTVAALHAILIALAEKHLHKPVPPRMVAGLPPLLTLEKLLFRMVELGWLILSLTLLSGVFFSEAIYGRAFMLTHMTVFGFASWGLYAALLAGRRVYGWRGKTAIYWTLAGFIALLLSYVGVKFVLEVILQRA